MLVLSNHSADYRNWAYCCVAIRKLTEKLDSYAAGLDSPEKHLLQIEDMLNLIGNVIEVTPRHSRNRAFLALNECSTDGSQVNGLDAFELLAYGYGKSV